VIYVAEITPDASTARRFQGLAASGRDLVAVVLEHVISR